MAAVGEPACQPEAISRQVGGHRRQHGGRAGVNLLAMLIVLAAE